VFTPEGFGWQSTAALGRLDLALIPNNLSNRATVRASVLAGADRYLATAAAHPYGVAFAPSNGRYFWGSNSAILNNLVVIGTAYDLSGATKYRDAAVQGMDYLLGRNALNQSYVTGYGEKSSQNQHSRWFANQLNAELPHPPAGSLAGGANSALEDPVALATLRNCKPQFCYIDEIQSFSTNEIAINWNSTLSWVAAFVADQGDGAAPVSARCTVRYSTTKLPFGWFAGQVTITNTGASTVDGWSLGWAFIGGQKVLVPAGATVTQAGASVTAKNIAANKKIKPNQSASFAFLASGAGPNPTPGLFVLNGAACS
jgi:endoglucanase